VQIAWRQVWNELDDLGSLLSLKRLLWEDNSSYKARIMDIFGVIEYTDKRVRGGEERSVIRNKAPDSTFIGLSIAIGRELGLVTFDENGDFSVKIKSISDRDFQMEELLDDDMVPNEKFEALVAAINKQAPVAWGDSRWDMGRWFDREQSEGWPTLKSIWDILSIKGDIT
jgi:hypothetical protein